MAGSPGFRMVGMTTNPQSDRSGTSLHHSEPRRRRFLLLSAAISAAAASAAFAQCPSAPTNVTVTRSYCGDATISFTLNGPTVGVDIRRGLVGAELANSILIGSVPTNLTTTGTLSFTELSSNPDKSYTYWAVAHGSELFCNATFASHPVVSEGPALTTSRLVASAGCNGVMLVWEPDPEASSYDITYRSSSGSHVIIAHVNAGVPPIFQDTTGTPGTIYDYRVFANLSCGRRASTIAQVMFPGAPVNHKLDYEIASAGTTSVTLSPPIDPLGSVGIWNWKRGEVPIAPSAKHQLDPFTGTLTITKVGLADADAYTVTRTTCFGSPVVAQVALVVTKPCLADTNDSGVITVQDLFDYLELFFSGCP